MEVKKFILNGTTAGIFTHNDDNTKLTISGWDHKWRELGIGEKILIASSSTPNEGHKYTVKKVIRPHDPMDQFFVDLEFGWK